MISVLQNTLFLTIIVLALMGLHVVSAQETNQEGDIDLPVMESMGLRGVDAMENKQGRYPTLQLTQDKSEMVTLLQKAASVVVGNPNHISVMLDTPNTLVIVPRAPGASHFSVIGEDGSVIMQRHVIVGAAKEQYVRIRRSCNANSGDCQPISTYFCPDMCHEVQENTQRLR